MEDPRQENRYKGEQGGHYTWEGKETHEGVGEKQILLL